MNRLYTMGCLVVFLCACLTVAATGQASPEPPMQQPDGSERTEPGRVGTSTVRPAKPVTGMPSDPPARSADHENTVGRPLLKHIALDQVGIWTSPGRARLKDATWLVPLAGLTAGLFVTDAQFSRHLSNSPSTLNHYQNLSNYGTFSLAGVAGGMYLLGHF